MSNRTEARKRELIDAARKLVRERLPENERDVAATFLERYFTYVPPGDIVDREPLDLYGAALAHFRFGQERRGGEAQVRVYNPSIDRHGWQSTHTIIEIVNEDMPFLVDSVGMELNRHGLRIHLVIHPIYSVRRTDGDRIEAIAPADEELDGSHGESFMHFEVDRQSDPEKLAALERDVAAVLADVRRAVEDWRPMLARVEDALSTCRAPGGDETGAQEEHRAFLKWLLDDNFTFIGYARYDLRPENGKYGLVPDEGSVLGILRDTARVEERFSSLTARHTREQHDPEQSLLVTKATDRSTVHRSSHLDVIAVKRYEDGRVLGEHRFFGLFTSTAYHLSPRSIPLLRRKLEKVFARTGFRRSGHAGKALLHILETYPRDELFQIDDDHLHRVAMDILHLQDRQRLRLFVRRDPFGRFVSCLVYVPRERYNTRSRKRMQEILVDYLDGSDCEFQTQVSEEILARILFTVHTGHGAPDDIDVADLEERLREASSTWTDRLRAALDDAEGEEEGNALFATFANAFPLAYQERMPARAAVVDIRHLDALSRDPERELALTVHRRLEDPQQLLHFRLVRKGEPVLLSDALPMLEDMGLRVLGEDAYPVEPEDGRRFSIHDFLLEPTVGKGFDVDATRHAFEEVFRDTWNGALESDFFNALVLAAGLGSRQISVLRAYSKYLLQIAVPFSQDYIEQTMISNPTLAKALVGYFEAYFDPAVEDRERAVEAAEQAIEEGLEQVAILDEDRIIRAFFDVMKATLRTNWYRRDENGKRRQYLSFKLDPRKEPSIPLPRPRYEIFVYAPWVEAVHLRGGKVARGGIRWSDRREDFRTEVLGLMKAQMVKNSVIVPVGAKGGFFVKKPPVGGDRAAQQDEAIRCYKTFLRGMLDITDNRTPEGVDAPPDVIRYDEDDPYLVVAADKGTATFSDIANAVSAEYGFWLDDAFASGGSAGYDHKGMAITAKGAWESVKRHFREMGHDTQSEPFTVVGVGDMSGDVFGNGMLLSEQIRLVAAFDHRHVFLDPDPDPASSFAERKRLFEQQRSTWENYDKDKISAGGGVYSRTTKSITLSPEARRALGTEHEQVSPLQLINMILKAPVDLLWNGGIGTYVKASHESHADAQDRNNDAIRVDGAELRCKVVGEGGNLGCTQFGRIEFAARGGRINTDFIDNSAGVDCSDHEVNIKILLGEVVRDGDLTTKQRNELLAEMTEEVGLLVLRDNVLQNLALSTADALGTDLVDAEIRLMRKLERSGFLNREIEMLPSDEQLLERRKEGRSLTRPEISVLIAYAKMSLYETLLDTEIPDRVYFSRDLAKYFPRPLRKRFAEVIERHRLRREIIATWIANSLVNRCLHVFVSEVEDDVDTELEQIVLGYVITRDSYRLLPLYAQVETLPASIDSEVQRHLLVALRDVLQNGTRWFIAHGGRPLGIRETVGRFQPGIAEIIDHLEDVLSPRGLSIFEERRRELTDEGVDETLARSAAAMSYLLPASDIVMASRDGDGRGSQLSVLAGARLYFAFDAALEIDQLRHWIKTAPIRTRWDRLALNSLEDRLAAALRRLTIAGIERGLQSDTSEDACGAVEGFLERSVYGARRYEALLQDLRAQAELDLAPLSVAVRAVNDLRIAS